MNTEFLKIFENNQKQLLRLKHNSRKGQYIYGFIDGMSNSGDRYIVICEDGTYYDPLTTDVQTIHPSGYELVCEHEKRYPILLAPSRRAHQKVKIPNPIGEGSARLTGSVIRYDESNVIVSIPPSSQLTTFMDDVELIF